jgi:hypothetical protein
LSFTPIYVLHMMTTPGGESLWVRSGTISMDPEGLPEALKNVTLNMQMEGRLDTVRAGDQRAQLTQG